MTQLNQTTTLNQNLATGPPAKKGPGQPWFTSSHDSKRVPPSTLDATAAKHRNKRGTPDHVAKVKSKSWCPFFNGGTKQKSFTYARAGEDKHAGRFNNTATGGGDIAPCPHGSVTRKMGHHPSTQLNATGITIGSATEEQTTIRERSTGGSTRLNRKRTKSRRAGKSKLFWGPSQQRRREGETKKNASWQTVRDGCVRGVKAAVPNQESLCTPPDGLKNFNYTTRIDTSHRETTIRPSIARHFKPLKAAKVGH